MKDTKMHKNIFRLVERRILEEKRKHPTLNWIKIASLKIAKDVESIIKKNKDEELESEEYKKIMRAISELRRLI